MEKPPPTDHHASDPPSMPFILKQLLLVSFVAPTIPLLPFVFDFAPPSFTVLTPSQGFFVCNLVFEPAIFDPTSKRRKNGEKKKERAYWPHKPDAQKKNQTPLSNSRIGKSWR